MRVRLPSTDGLSPRDVERVRSLPTLLEHARGALERELGATFVVSEGEAASRCWSLELGPDRALHLDRRKQVLRCTSPDVDGLFETLSWLRSLTGRPDGSLAVVDCSTASEAADRVRDEVAITWPSFASRGLSWRSLCERHHPAVVRASDPIAALQRWLVPLGDAHTAVRPTSPQWTLPYTLHLTPDRAVLHDVPPDSAGWKAGARPGMHLEGLDRAELWGRTGASPHQRPWVAGRLALRGPQGPATLRTRTVTWTEERQDPWKRPLLVERHGRVGLLGVEVFAPGMDLDGALTSLAGVERLVVDLRNHGGGNVGMARAFQARFLREPTLLGTVRTTRPSGALGPAEPLENEPRDPWPTPVRFLTSPRTYSAAEDFLLGLQGLPHVEVWGERSGGGSGRVRSLRLLPGWRLTVSTALTWDRRQHLVEGQGIPVDRRLPEVPGRPLAAIECIG